MKSVIQGAVAERIAGFLDKKISKAKKEVSRISPEGYEQEEAMWVDNSGSSPQEEETVPTGPVTPIRQDVLSSTSQRGMNTFNRLTRSSGQGRFGGMTKSPTSVQKSIVYGISSPESKVFKESLMRKKKSTAKMISIARKKLSRSF